MWKTESDWKRLKMHTEIRCFWNRRLFALCRAKKGIGNGSIAWHRFTTWTSTLFPIAEDTVHALTQSLRLCGSHQEDFRICDIGKSFWIEQSQTFAAEACPSVAKGHIEWVPQKRRKLLLHQRWWGWDGLLEDDEVECELPDFTKAFNTVQHSLDWSNTLSASPCSQNIQYHSDIQHIYIDRYSLYRYTNIYVYIICMRMYIYVCICMYVCTCIYCIFTISSLSIHIYLGVKISRSSQISQTSPLIEIMLEKMAYMWALLT